MTHDDDERERAEDDLGFIEYRLGITCYAVLPDGRRCQSRSSRVSRDGYPVCGHHTNPRTPTSLWPAPRPSRVHDPEVSS